VEVEARLEEMGLGEGGRGATCGFIGVLKRWTM